MSRCIHPFRPPTHSYGALSDRVPTHFNRRAGLVGGSRRNPTGAFDWSAGCGHLADTHSHPIMHSQHTHTHTRKQVHHCPPGHRAHVNNIEHTKIGCPPPPEGKQRRSKADNLETKTEHIIRQNRHHRCTTPRGCMQPIASLAHHHHKAYPKHTPSKPNTRPKTQHVLQIPTLTFLLSVPP